MSDKTQIRIRQASALDVEFLVDCQKKMAWETEQIRLDETIVNEGVKAVFSDNKRGFYIVAESENQKCGCLMITPEWSDWRNAWVWWIQSVFVLPGHRKKGIFSSMYAYIKQQVMYHTDVSGIRLYVDNTNNSAQTVYQRLGMTDEHYRTFEWMK